MTDARSLHRSLDCIAHQHVGATVDDLVFARFAHGAGHFQHVEHDAIHDGEAVQHRRLLDTIVIGLGVVVDHDTFRHVEIAAIMRGTAGIGTVAGFGGGDAFQQLALALVERVQQLRIVQRQQLRSLHERTNIVQRDAVEDALVTLQQLRVAETGGDGGIIDGGHHTPAGGLVAVHTGESALAGLFQHGEGIGLFAGGPDLVAVHVDQGAGGDGHVNLRGWYVIIFS